MESGLNAGNLALMIHGEGECSQPEGKGERYEKQSRHSRNGAVDLSKQRSVS